MEPKTILSLFDYSGQWTAPFAAAGHDVIMIDAKHDPELHDIAKFSVEYLIEVLGIEWVDAIIAAPDCTHFTNAGAQYWRIKDSDGRTAAAAHLVRQTLRCVEFYKPDFWVLENPVGRLPKVVAEIGPATFRFDPCDFAGELGRELTAAEISTLEEMLSWFELGRKFTAAEIDLVKRSNRYTKRTCLWGHFNVPTISRREPIRVCAQGSWLQRLGGTNGEGGKAARSDTPEGFARAFHAANDWSAAAVKGWGGTSLERIEAEEAEETGLIEQLQR